MGLARGLLSVAFVEIAGVAPAAACAFADPDAARAQSLDTTTAYLIAAIAGVVAAAVLQAYRGRWSPFTLGVAGVLLAPHPRWTMAPSYGPDCQFVNVQASIGVLAVVCLILALEVFKVARSRRDRPKPSTS